MCFLCNDKPLNFSLVFTTCRVCEMLDGNKSNKPVSFCDFCKSYICKDCWYNPVRRAAAALKNWIT